MWLQTRREGEGGKGRVRREGKEERERTAWNYEVLWTCREEIEGIKEGNEESM